MQWEFFLTKRSKLYISTVPKLLIKATQTLRFALLPGGGGGGEWRGRGQCGGSAQGEVQPRRNVTVTKASTEYFKI